MLDAGLFWPPPPDLAMSRVETRALVAQAVAARLTLVSGDIAAGLAALAPGVPPQGPHVRADGPVQAIRLGLDRALLVELDDPEPSDASGWNAGGFAATDASESLVLVLVEGPGAFDALARFTGVDLTAPPPSSGGAAGLVFGEIRLAAWRQGEHALMLAVERSRVAYVFDVLAAVGEIL